MHKVLLPLPGVSLFYTQDVAQRNHLLAKAIAVLGQTGKLTFPHAKASLSHSKNALVVAVLHLDNNAVGLGVDVEAFRPLRLPGALRFYANPAEQDWWASQPQPDIAAIQLWTIKEAAYKAYNPKDRSLVKPRVSNWVSVPCPFYLSQTNYLSQANPNPLATHWQVSHTDSPYKGFGLTFALWPETWVSVCVLTP